MSLLQRLTMMLILAILFVAPLSVHAEIASDASSIDQPSKSLPRPVAHVTLMPSAEVTNENYASLKVCPATPTNCPDINGKVPGGGLYDRNSATCPASCTVTRAVNTIQIGNVTKVLSTRDAVCPAGYSQVASYNAQEEILYSNNPPPAPWPIPNMATYQAYVSNGFVCTASGSNSHYKYCSDPGISVGQIRDDIKQANGVARVYDDNSQCWTKGSSCGLHASCSVAHDRSHDIRYTYMVCMPPAGLYYSSTVNPGQKNMVSASIVCSLVAHTWQNTN